MYSSEEDSREKLNESSRANGPSSLKEQLKCIALAKRILTAYYEENGDIQRVVKPLSAVQGSIGSEVCGETMQTRIDHFFEVSE